jgi:hypothetical protein
MTATPPPSPGSVPTSLLSLAGRAGHRFIPHVMVQGFACYIRGVEVVSASDRHVHARVRSKRTHDVDLRADGGKLLVACTCPKQSLELAVCKHAWAALLEVDRGTSLAGLRADRGIIAVVGVDRADAAPPKSAAGDPNPDPKREKTMAGDPNPDPKPEKTTTAAKPKDDAPSTAAAKPPRGRKGKAPTREARARATRETKNDETAAAKAAVAPIDPSSPVTVDALEIVAQPPRDKTPPVAETTPLAKTLPERTKRGAKAAEKRKAKPKVTAKVMAKAKPPRSAGRKAGVDGSRRKAARRR